MLHPSYTDLMKVVNKDVEEGKSKIVNSRYSMESYAVEDYVTKQLFVPENMRQ